MHLQNTQFICLHPKGFAEHFSLWQMFLIISSVIWRSADGRNFLKYISLMDQKFTQYWLWDYFDACWICTAYFFGLGCCMNLVQSATEADIVQICLALAEAEGGLEVRELSTKRGLWQCYRTQCNSCCLWKVYGHVVKQELCNSRLSFCTSRQVLYTSRKSFWWGGNYQAIIACFKWMNG